MTAGDVVDYVYDSLIERAAIPPLEQIAAAFQTERVAMARFIREAKLGKTVLLDGNDEIWMAGPFSAVATPYRIRHGDKSWFANCAWDALGVAALVNAPVDVSATCADCGERLDFRVGPEDADVPDWTVHFLVPARRWYDDIGFT